MSRGPGSYSEVLNLRISAEMAAEIDRIAAARGVKRADFVRQALDSVVRVLQINERLNPGGHHDQGQTHQDQ
jgi:uncharacterized protein (DUF1778 family)